MIGSCECVGRLVCLDLQACSPLVSKVAKAEHSPFAADQQGALVRLRRGDHVGCNNFIEALNLELALDAHRGRISGTYSPVQDHPGSNNTLATTPSVRRADCRVQQQQVRQLKPR